VSYFVPAQRSNSSKLTSRDIAKAGFMARGSNLHGMKWILTKEPLVLSVNARWS